MRLTLNIQNGNYVDDIKCYDCSSFFVFEVNCSMFVGFLLQYYGKL